MTTVARGRWTSAPAPWETPIGMKPRLATRAVIRTGRKRAWAPCSTADSIGGFWFCWIPNICQQDNSVQDCNPKELLRIPQTTFNAIVPQSGDVSGNERRVDQSSKKVVGFPGRERSFAVYPPIQHQDKCRGHKLNEQSLGNRTCRLPLGYQVPLDALGNQFDEYPLKVSVKDGSPAWSQPEPAAPTMPIKMLEDRQAKCEYPFVKMAATLRMG